MKINKNKIIIKMLIFAMMIVVLGNSSYAINKQKNTTFVNQENKETEKEVKKAELNEGALLEDFGIVPNDFKGFLPNKKNYNTTVPKNVNKIEIYARPKDKNVQVTGTGTKDLKIGENKFTVTVIGENGSKSDYNLIVIRGKETEETSKEEIRENTTNKELGNGIQTLTIEDIELSPKFDTKKYEYTAKYIGDKQELKVEAKATDPYYEVEITGNKELKDGENTITILVSDPDGKNVATYQVILIKEKLGVIDSVEKVKEIENQRKIILVFSGVAVIAIVLIIFIIAKRRDKKLTQEYSIPFSGLNSEDEEENDYEKENDDKQDLRQEFLDNYNNENDDYENDDCEKEKKRRKGKYKGKRFK